MYSRVFYNCLAQLLSLHQKLEYLQIAGLAHVFEYEYLGMASTLVTLFGYTGLTVRHCLMMQPFFMRPDPPNFLMS